MRCVFLTSYIVKSGKALSNWVVYGPTRYFGEDMLLADFDRPHFVMSLTFLDVFRLTKTDLGGILDSGRFPAMKVTRVR